MEVITIEAEVWKELVGKIENIDRYVREKGSKEENLEEMYVTRDQVCKYLRISVRTLQRLRSNHIISYTKIGGSTYYTIAEIKRVLDAKLVRCNEALLKELIQHYRSSISSRENATKP